MFLHQPSFNIVDVVSINVKKLRRQMNITQEQLAAALETSSTYISQIERGEKNITIKTIERLCCVFNVPPEALLEFSEYNWDGRMIEMSARPAVTDIKLNYIIEEYYKLSEEQQQKMCEIWIRTLEL